MIITVEELESETCKYLELAQSEYIYIMRNGKIVAKLTAIEDEESDS